MKLNYYLLWVEDDDSWFKATSELFEMTIKDFGFDAIIKRKKTLLEVNEEIEKDNLKKFDICLTPVLSPSDAAKHLKMVFSKTGHLPFLPQMGLNTPIKVTVTHKKRSLLCDLGLSIAQIKKLKQKGILS